MARLCPTVFISLLVSTVYAAYDEFYFTTDATKYQCPLSAFQCAAPQACVHESLLDKWYCCAPGADAVCWSPDSGCDGTAGSNEVACGDSSYTFCCLKGREECTQRTNQINICWALPENALANATDAKMNETYSSLSSASPSATSLVFELAQIFPSSIPTSTSTSSTTVTGTSNSASLASSTTSPASAPLPSSSSGLSGGATAGIVVAAIALLAIIGAASFFLWRTMRNAKANGADLTSNPYGGNGGYGQMAGVEHEKYRHEMEQPAVELDARSPVAEMGAEGKWKGAENFRRGVGI